MRCSPLRFMLAISLLFCVQVCAGEAAPASPAKLNNDITVEGAFVNIPLPGKTTTAGFFTLHNRAARDIALVAVHTDIAGRTELHSHSHENGVMRMRREERAVIPANSSLAFASGSWHVMFFNITKTLRTGDQLHLTLMFDDGTSLPVAAQVRSLFDQPHH